MFHWLHHLLNPHCPDCAFEAEGKKVCQSCETLKTQLAISNDEKRQLLNTILSFSKPAEQTVIAGVNPEGVKQGMMTWGVRKRMLEQEDRKTAQLLAEQKKHHSESIEKLEGELGLEEEVKSNAKA